MFFLDSVMLAGGVARGLIGFAPQQAAPGMSASNFEASVERVLAVEGGYVEHRVDPGGATKHGVTRFRLAQYRGRPVAKAEVRALTRAEAIAIYKTIYWDALKADELPPGLDHALFDFEVHSGVPRAARALQGALGVAEDGRIGPATIAAARRADAEAVLARMRRDRLAFMSGLPAWRVFGKGWRRGWKRSKRWAGSARGWKWRTRARRARRLRADSSKPPVRRLDSRSADR